MYPSFYELFKYTLGLEIPFLKLIQTFGFFMVMSFVVGGIVTRFGFKRMERNGWMHGVKEKITVGDAPNIFSLLFNSLFGFLVGYKLVHAFLNSAQLFADPQSFLLNRDGNIWGGLAFAVLLGLVYYRDKKVHQLPEPVVTEEVIMPHERISELLVFAAVFGIAGAKILASVEDWDTFIQDPIGSLLSFSGLTYYGGLIMAALAIIVYAFRKKIPLLKLMDVAAPALILGYGVGRLGCHFSGDGDWGIPIQGPNRYLPETYDYSKPEWLSFLPDWLYASTYPHNVAREGVQIPGCEGIYCLELNPAVFVTSIWEFILAVLIFAILIKIRNHLKIPGMLFAFYLMFNGLERFIVESVRVNPRYDFMGYHPSQAQFIAIGLLALGLLMALILKAVGKKYEPSALKT